MAEATIPGAKTGNSDGTGFGQNLRKRKLFWQRNPAVIRSGRVLPPSLFSFHGVFACLHQACTTTGYATFIHFPKVWSFAALSRLVCQRQTRKLLSASVTVEIVMAWMNAILKVWLALTDATNARWLPVEHAWKAARAASGRKGGCIRAHAAHEPNQCLKILTILIQDENFIYLF